MCTQHYDWFEGGSGISWFAVAIETIAVECRRQQGCRWPHMYAGVGFSLVSHCILTCNGERDHPINSF